MHQAGFPDIYSGIPLSVLSISKVFNYQKQITPSPPVKARYNFVRNLKLGTYINTRVVSENIVSTYLVPRPLQLQILDCSKLAVNWKNGNDVNFST